jgi:two-component system invasion response regulator UvrY
MSPPIRILVVDDQSLVRSGICASLAGLPNLEVVGQAASGQEAIQLSATLKPDLILLDLNLPDIAGREVISVLLKETPKVKILILTCSLDTFLIPQFFSCGASGFFNKVDGYKELLKAIEMVNAGHLYVSPEMTRKIQFELNTQLANPFDALSERELQVVLLIHCGFTLDEIAIKLKISGSTCKTYRLRITEKLGVKNDVELILMTARYGLLEAL